MGAKCPPEQTQGSRAQVMSHESLAKEAEESRGGP